MSEERELFEEEIFKQYFLSTIQKNPNPPKFTGALDFISVDCLNKSEFCERDGEHYKRPDVSAAWWGWNARAAFAS